uniref:Uncharacterized protein n=2 Tax=Plectus sambesii TaxID=2011161 RepID=A0A914WTZ9_9BILA
MDARSVIRGWFTITIVQLLGTAFQCLDSKLTAERVFSVAGRGQVSPLYCRLLATWYVMLAVLRLVAVVAFDSRPVHLINLSLIAVTVGYFAMEAFIFRTVDIANVAVATNLMMSVVTLVLVAICWQYLWKGSEPVERNRTSRGKTIGVGKEFSEFGPFSGVTRTTLTTKKDL